MDLPKTKDNDKKNKNDANILLKEECPLALSLLYLMYSHTLMHLSRI